MCVSTTATRPVIFARSWHSFTALTLEVVEEAEAEHDVESPRRVQIADVLMHELEIFGAQLGLEAAHLLHVADPALDRRHVVTVPREGD